MIWALLVSAHAHIGMDTPTTRGPDQKIGPCGSAVDVRGTEINVFQPGETITVSWRETINHPSHYRISFDDDGTDAFEDPATPDDFYTNPSVLLDEIFDSGGTLTAEVTLPSVTCENCTLQVIQVMLDKPPYVPGTNDIYYQCADLALRGDPADPPTGTDTGVDDTGTGDTDTGASAVDDGSGCGCANGRSGAPWLVAFALIAARSRRR